MVEDITLTPGDFAVLSRVPLVWWDESNVVLEISFALTETKATVRKRLAHIVALRLVERRKRNTIAATTEIRRIAK
jgi:predicted transcriptional regulator